METKDVARAPGTTSREVEAGPLADDPRNAPPENRGESLRRVCEVFETESGTD